MNRKAALALLSMFLASPATAQTDDQGDPGYLTQQLKDACQPAAGEGDAAKAADDKICQAYLRGITDGLFMLAAAQDSNVPLCLPQDGPISPAEARDDFNSYVADHPEALQHAAGMTAAIAIIKAHSCE
jgi:hypothetical protein